MGRPLEVGDIECQHHIGAVVTLLPRHAEIERMLLGKLRRELQSHTGAPKVSAIAITWSQPYGGLAAKSAMTTGRSAAANASAALASAAGSGAGAAGTRAAPGGGSGTS
jgi:hypothetical protein